MQRSHTYHEPPEYVGQSLPEVRKCTMPMMWYATENGSNWMLGMLVMWFFWLMLLVGGTWAVLHWLRSVPASPMTPMETLHLRYARGEIDTLTFEQMRERLRGTESAPPPISEREIRS
jgi:putative membrane protein